VRGPNAWLAFNPAKFGRNFSLRQPQKNRPLAGPVDKL
jgi:hypothetical protein